MNFIGSVKVSKRIDIDSGKMIADSVEYALPVNAYETNGVDKVDSMRESFNRMYGVMTGRKFSIYWQSRGISIALISQLQYCRFNVDESRDIIGRDIFLRDYEIDSSVIWSLVHNIASVDCDVIISSDDKRVECWRTESGKRTRNGKSSNGKIRVKSTGKPKTYKRIRTMRGM